MQTANGGNTRVLHFGDRDDSESRLAADRWPWNLYLREGSESADQWNLPDAVNDPLFGLPPLPEQDLPASPYRHLSRFTRKDAEVFFGRGHQIRELCERLTAPRTAPIMLFYGQSGVGKSSILDAGLIPRLEQDYEVRYLRRTEGGLLDTLRLAFLPEADYEHPHFGQELYHHLKRDGILLRDFLNQQIGTFRERYPEAVDSGLLLDIVALHTTPLGTADTTLPTYLFTPSFDVPIPFVTRRVFLLGATVLCAVPAI